MVANKQSAIDDHESKSLHKINLENGYRWQESHLLLWQRAEYRDGCVVTCSIAALLFEMVSYYYFKTVNMNFFVVVSHTQNVCKGGFNNLKKDCHKSQVFTFEQAVKVLGKSLYVTVWPINMENDWFDYINFLLEPYRCLELLQGLIACSYDRSSRGPITSFWQQQTKQ